MAKVIVTESYLENIGDAIRSKLGTQDTYSPSEMAGAISQIHGDPVLETLSATQNGTYTPSSGKDGFSQAVVNVPNSYSAGDEGKVVSNGALVAQSSTTKNANGTYDTTLNNQVVINVPNSYSASDEGKVVDNGALVAQTSQSITENGTYDTTLKNEVIVDVAGGGGTALILLDKELTQSSGGSISIDETVTISEAGDYYIICYGYSNNVDVYINGVLQSNNFDNSSDYFHAYSQKKTLSVGDIVRVNIPSSGMSNMRAFIAAV